MARRKDSGIDRSEPQFGYEYRRKDPYLEEPAVTPRLTKTVRRRRDRSLIPIFLVGAVIILFAGFLGISYLKGPRLVSGQLPVITAEKTPVKIKPDTPGGAPIPFQDTTVYDDLHLGKQKHAANEVEHLLQPAEQPLPMPSPAPPAAAPATGVAPGLQPAAPTIVETTPATTAAVPQVPAPAAPNPADDDQAALAPPEPKTLPVPPATPATLPPAPKPAQAAKPAVTKPAPATPSGTSTIQLGSFKDEAAARGEWQRLKGRYSDQLSALSPTVQRVDLGEKGIWYRLRAGPLSADKAKVACEALTDAKAPCIASIH